MYFGSKFSCQTIENGGFESSNVGINKIIARTRATTKITAQPFQKRLLRQEENRAKILEVVLKSKRNDDTSISSHRTQ